VTPRGGTVGERPSSLLKKIQNGKGSGERGDTKKGRRSNDVGILVDRKNVKHECKSKGGKKTQRLNWVFGKKKRQRIMRWGVGSKTWRGAALGWGK